MNDRLKFRGWHKGYPAIGKRKAIEPRMIYDRDEFPGKCLAFLADGQPIIPMQCTGLKDSAQTAIYEGDVVEIRAETSTGSHKDRCAVEWNQHHWMINRKMNSLTDNWQSLQRLDDLSHEMPRWYFITVIGNIHENPELLEAKG